MNYKQNLMFAYMHLPQKLMFLSNPPKDITLDKYSDLVYLERCKNMIDELVEDDFDTRDDGVLPYSKDVLVNHFTNIIDELKGLNRGKNETNK